MQHKDEVFKTSVLIDISGILKNKIKRHTQQFRGFQSTYTDQAIIPILFYWETLCLVFFNTRKHSQYPDKVEELPVNS